MIYEHAHEETPPVAEYDPAMDIPEPKREPVKLPFPISRTIDGARIYRMGQQTIITRRDRWTKWAIILLKNVNAPHIECERKDVARLLRHLRKEARPC